MNKNKPTGKLWDYILSILMLLSCIVLVGIIPGAVWFIVGILAEILVKLDKITTQLNQSFFRLGWGILVIDAVLGIGLYVYLRRRYKDK
jgi:hypothetical protein